MWTKGARIFAALTTPYAFIENQSYATLRIIKNTASRIIGGQRQQKADSQ
jgi:hypothetical protein